MELHLTAIRSVTCHVGSHSVTQCHTAAPSQVCNKLATSHSTGKRD